MVGMRSSISTFLLLLCALRSNAQTCPAAKAKGALCMAANYPLQGGTGGNLQCTSNDIDKNTVTLDITNILDGCTGTTDTATFEADLTYTVTSQTRYDLGLYISTGGASALSDGSCDIFTFACKTTPDDDDQCGDREQATHEEKITATVPCPASGQDVNAAYCFGWGQQEDEIECDVDPFSPIVARPGTPSKCLCDTVKVNAGVCEIMFKDTITTSGLMCDSGVPAAIVIQSTDILSISPAGTEFHYYVDKTVGTTTTTGPFDYSVGASIIISAPVVDATYSVTIFGSRPDGSGVCSDKIEIKTPECCSNEDCDVSNNEYCCPENRCEVRGSTNGIACGDPHMTGFLGQKFDFTGEGDAWYALIKDDHMHVNMRVTSPLPELPVITYITGLSVLTTDSNGLEHSIVIEVKEPHTLASSCPDGVSPCLADGSLSVVLDGQEYLLGPGEVSLGEDLLISAVNLPGACRSFGFEHYWERKKLEYALAAGRRLSGSVDMGEWILGDHTATNMEECTEYVAKAEMEAGGLFAHQSEHASFQIATPKATIRLSHGRLHQIPMRDPTDQFDLPDHRTWQMNFAVDRTQVSHSATGVLGETFLPTMDVNGMPIMHGMASIRGSEEDYRVEGPYGVYFAQDA